MKKLTKFGVSLVTLLTLSPILAQSYVSASETNSPSVSQNQRMDSSNALKTEFEDNLENNKMTKSVDQSGDVTYTISDQDLYNSIKSQYPNLDIESPNDGDISLDGLGSKVKGRSSFKFYGSAKKGNFRASLSKFALNLAKSQGVSFMLGAVLAPIGAIPYGGKIAYYVLKKVLTKIIMHYNHFYYGRNFYFHNFNYTNWTYQRS